MQRDRLPMAEQPITVDRIREVLRNCYDPEIPVNIVDLGLIYDIAVVGEAVRVRMTLTAQGCPASAYLSQQVKDEIERLPGVKKADVEIVWDPPWTPERMSQEARKKLQAVQEERVALDFDSSNFKPMKKGHLVKNPDGTMILINPANSRYSVNADIALLWEKSDGTRTIDELAAIAASELQLSPVEVRPQIVELYRSLISSGLVEPETKPSDLLPMQP